MFRVTRAEEQAVRLVMRMAHMGGQVTLGDLADAALEDGRLLEQRGLDGPVAVAGGQRRGDGHEAVEDRAVVGEEVTGAPGVSEGRHRPQG